MTLADVHRKEVPFFFLQGHAVQQNYPEGERNLFWLDVQAAFDLSPKDSIKVLTVDVSASIGTRQPHEGSSVCGFFGLQRAKSCW
jgi:hypothetical protein